MSQRCQHGLWDSMNCRGLSRRSRAEKSAFLYLRHQNRGDPEAVQWSETESAHAPGCCTPPCGPAQQQQVPPSAAAFSHQPALTLATLLAALARPLSSAHAPLYSSIFPTPPSQTHSSEVAFTRTALHAKIYCNK